MSRLVPAGVSWRRRPQGGWTGVPNKTTPCSTAGRSAFSALERDLEAQDLLADQEVVAV